MGTLPGISDQELAQRVITAYADRDRLTRDELEDIGFNSTQARAIRNALGPDIDINDDDEVTTSVARRMATASDGLISASERRRLEATPGLTTDFINALRGDHGTASTRSLSTSISSSFQRPKSWPREALR